MRWAMNGRRCTQESVSQGWETNTHSYSQFQTSQIKAACLWTVGQMWCRHKESSHREEPSRRCQATAPTTTPLCHLHTALLFNETFDCQTNGAVLRRGEAGGPFRRIFWYVRGKRTGINNKVRLSYWDTLMKQNSSCDETGASAPTE